MRKPGCTFVGPPYDTSILSTTENPVKEVCENIKAHVPEVIAEWDRLVREEPWFTLPAKHRIDSLPEVLVGIVEASLCEPASVEAHRQKVHAAAEHGFHRRTQNLPETVIFTEYHLLRQAIWHFLDRSGTEPGKLLRAVSHIDLALTVATNASLWGYHREAIQALGKWEEGMERLVFESPFLKTIAGKKPAAP
jgi:hypothetical protein